jgi:phenylacetate-CoA ligase
MSSKAEALYFSSPVWLQNVMVSAVGYKLYQKRYTGMYYQLRELVQESRTWGTIKREAYQSEKLHQMVKHCRTHIPYYQKVFAEYGLHENDVTDVSHIQKLPILDKRTLSERSAEFRSGREKPFMLQHTSGSTGTPLSLQVNELTYKVAMALLVDHEEYHGVPFGAPRATFAGRMIQRPQNTNPPFSRVNRAENQRLYSSYHLNKQTFPFYKQDLNHFQPWELIGYPSALCDLATHYEQTGMEPGFRPRAIITNSETLLDWQRERIEKVLKCPVYDYYGTAEYVLFAAQDSTGIYQNSPIIGITEVQTGDDLMCSVAGSIHATSLTNTCMPLIRYEIGDVATLPKPNDGKMSTTRTLSAIQGRLDDYIKTPDGRKIGRIDHIFKGVTGIKEAQVIQDSLHHCTIKVVLQTSEDKIDREKIKENLRARTFGTMEISLITTDHINRSANGKFKAVVSLIDD